MSYLNTTMSLWTVTTVVHFISMWILVPLENAPIIVVRHCMHMLSSIDTINLANFTWPIQMKYVIVNWYYNCSVHLNMNASISGPWKENFLIILYIYVVQKDTRSWQLLFHLSMYEWVMGYWYYSHPCNLSVNTSISGKCTDHFSSILYKIVSYDKHMLCSKDTNTMLNVTTPNQIRICGSKLIRQSFN
jgi:hypothetical protein